MRKKLLASMTVILLLAGLVCASIPFASALRPTARARNDATTIIEIDKIQSGVLQKFTVDGLPLFILRPDAAQWASIHQMDAYVWDKRMQSWSPELEAFVYWGWGTHWGNELEMKPANSSEMVNEYNVDPSSFAKEDHPVWLGGFWNIYEEESYDLAGRTIKDWAHTYAGYNSELPNLTPAHVALIAPSKLAIYHYR